MGKYKKEIKHCEKCNKPFFGVPEQHRNALREMQGSSD